MAAPVLFRHPSSLEHDTGPHPENANRIAAIEAALVDRDWLGWDVRLSPAATREQLAAVHPPHHIDRIEAISARGGGMLDLDTVVGPGSFRAALHAAGGCVALVDALLGGAGDGAVAVGASLHRPPGHHAEPAQAMGFCLFGNVAIAAQHALDAHGASRVMIVDWDVHHGNGTNAIFDERADVLFCSIHESPLYPGTGAASDAGRGDGAGFTVNMPVPAGSGDEVFVSLVAHVVRPLALAYEPDLLLVSAGFDAHRDDPLAGCRVSDAGFGAMAAIMRATADELGVGLGFVLEGGYDLGALARSVVATLVAVTPGEETYAAAVDGAAAAVAVHSLALQAQERLAGSHWPALA